jgi:hypothetical protein
MKISIALGSLAALALSACGGSSGGNDQQSNAENAAGQLDNAAEVSDPAAAQVLENGADRIRAEGGANAAAEAQNVLQNAGNAQAR